MSRTPINPRLVCDLEKEKAARVKDQKLRDRLSALVPRDVCEAVVREDITRLDEQYRNERWFKILELVFPNAHVNQSEHVVAEEVDKIADALCYALRAMLLFIAHEQGCDKPIRLDNQLLPQGYDNLLRETRLPNWREYYERLLWCMLEDDGIKKVVDAFIARVREEVDKTLDGLEVYEGVVIRKDADGYYIAPRI